MRVGLLRDQQGDHQMLDLQEIRDMLLFTRVSITNRTTRGANNYKDIKP
jgi:hypothetical protein